MAYPVTCSPSGYPSNIGASLRENRFVLGDFNTRLDRWISFQPVTDRSGMELAKQIDVSIFYIMNDEFHTRIMGTCNSSVDITVASRDLINSIS